MLISNRQPPGTVSGMSENETAAAFARLKAQPGDAERLAYGRNRVRARGRARLIAVLAVLAAVTGVVGAWWTGPYWPLRSQVAALGFGDVLDSSGSEVRVSPLERAWSGSSVTWYFEVPDDMTLDELTVLVQTRARRAGLSVAEPTDGAFSDGTQPYRDFEVRAADGDLTNVMVIALPGQRPWNLQVSASD